MNELKSHAKGQSSLPRRTFVKHFLLGTAFSTILGKEWFATVIADCQPTTSTGGILRVKVSDFPALQAENGSVRLLLNPINDLTQLPNGFFYPVLVNRGTGNQFFGLRAACTHMGCVVPTFGNACPCHGSQYGIDGSVIVGVVPGQAPLTRYTINFDGVDLLCVEIPNLRYVLTGSVLQSGIGPRLRIQFQTRLRVNYEVRVRQSVSDAGVVTQFSTTEGGTADTSVLTGNGGIATVYVDRTADAGFYSVAVQVAEG